MNKEYAKLNFEDLQRNLGNPNTEWKTREENLQTLLAELSNKTLQNSMVEKLANLGQPLAIQLSDLRSTIVKLASEVIQQISCLSVQKYKKAALQRFGDEFLKEPALVKALGCGNKLIARYAQNALQKLSVNDFVSFETLRIFSEQNKVHKIAAVRERVAETVLGFMEYVLLPRRPTKTSLFSGQATNEKHRSSEDGSEDERLSNDQVRGLAFAQRSTRPKTANKIVSQKLTSNGNQTESGARTTRLKPENITFFKDISEFFMKDANANVRDAAKEIKRHLPLFEVALVNFCENKDSVVSTETAEEFEIKQNLVNKTAKFPVAQQTIQNAFASHELRPPLNAPKANNLSRVHSNLALEKPNTKLINPTPALLPELLLALTDQNMPVKEKLNQIDKLIQLTGKKLEPTLDQYIELLRHADLAKNTLVKDNLVRLLIKMNVERFKMPVFQFVLERKLLDKASFAVFMQELYSQFGLKFLLNAFLTRNDDQLPAFLDKNFSIDDFETLIITDYSYVERVVARIVENVKFCKSTSESHSKFLTENFSLFEKIMQSKDVIIYCSTCLFDDFFTDSLKKVNPSLFKFLSMKRSKAGQDLPPTSLLQKPSELPESILAENNKIQELMKKANLATRKNILKSIISHVLKLSQREVTPVIKHKIASKTLDILRVTVEVGNKNDEESIKTIFELSHHLITANLEHEQLTDLFEILCCLYSNHDSTFSSLIYHQISNFSLAEPRFINYCLYRAKSGSLIHLKMLASLFEVYRNIEKRKDALQVIDLVLKELISVIKNVLIIHRDIQMRKGAVEVLVQIYRLVGHEEAVKLNARFTLEQQALINVYFKKSLL